MGESSRSVVRGAVLALLFVVAVAAPGTAAWTEPFAVTGFGRDPAVAFTSGTTGVAAVAWTSYDGANHRVNARIRAADGTMTAVETLSAAGRDARLPRVAVDAEGTAVFAWVRHDGANWRVQARARSATGALSRVQTLSAAGGDGYWPELAVDAEGNAIFTWALALDGTTYRVQTRSRSRTGDLSAVRTLSRAGDANGPHVAVDSGGKAVFTWHRFDGETYRIQARWRSAAGELSRVQNLSAAGQHAFSPRVALDAAGNAVFTWFRFDGTNYRAQARARSVDGVLSPVQTLSAAGASVTSTQVGVDANGNAVLSWLRSGGTSGSRLQVRGRSAAGMLTPVETLSDPGASEARMAVSRNGAAVFLWRLLGADADQIQSRARAAGGTVGPVETFAANGSWPALAVDPDGNALAVYLDGGSGTFVGRTGP